MYKYFIRGSWLLEKNVDDSDAYYEQHKTAIESILKWADELHVYASFCVSEDKTYLCEYGMLCDMKSMCSVLSDDLKEMLESEWKDIRLGYQRRGCKL